MRGQHPWLCALLAVGCTKGNPWWTVPGGGSDSTGSETASGGPTVGGEMSVSSTTSATSVSDSTVTTGSTSTSASGTASGDETDGATTGSGIPACDEVDAATVAYYRFENIPDDPMRDETGDHHGTMWNAEVASAIPGPRGCGDAFLGGPGLAGTVADADAFDLAVGSLDLWVRAPVQPDAAALAIVARDSMGPGPGHLSLFLGDVTPAGQSRQSGHVFVRHQAGNVSVGRCSAEPVPVDQWVHIGINFGPPGLQLFVDGELQQNDGEAYLYPPGVGSPTPCNDPQPGGIETINDWAVGGGSLDAEAGTFEPGHWFAGGGIDELRISSIRRPFAD